MYFLHTIRSQIFHLYILSFYNTLITFGKFKIISGQCKHIIPKPISRYNFYGKILFIITYKWASKSTPIGAIALFAAAGMRLTKKNIGFMCMSYGNVYVASIAMGANRQQTLAAIKEAEAYNGPSIIFAYAPCMLHGINMTKSQVEQKRAVEAGYWPLYRYNPANEKPFIWETKDASASYKDFIMSENRYKQLLKATSPENAEALFTEAEENAKKRMDFYKKIGEIF